MLQTLLKGQNEGGQGSRSCPISAKGSVGFFCTPFGARGVRSCRIKIDHFREVDWE